MATLNEGLMQPIDGYVYGWEWENGDWAWWSTLELALEFDRDLVNRPGVLHRRRYEVGEPELFDADATAADPVEGEVDVERVLPGTMPRVTYRDVEYSQGYGGTATYFTEEDDLSKVNGISSRVKRTKGAHAPIFDIDVPAQLIPSSTPGHSHLYVDVIIPWWQYKRLLKEMAKGGIVDPKFVMLSVKKKMGFLRPPWIKKEGK